MRQIMKILIIKLRNIGDVLLITPLFENLKAHFKECTIDVLVNKNTKDILNTKDINKIMVIDRSKNKFDKLISELKLLRDIRNSRYDIVLGLTSGDRSAFFSFISGAKVRVGFTPKNLWSKWFYTHKLEFKYQHTIESNLDVLRIINIPIISKRVISNTADDFHDKQIREKLPQRFIHCHFFSNWFFKCLDDKFCVEILDFIENTYNIECILTTSNNKTEKIKLNNMLSIRKKPIIYFDNLSLPEVSLLNSKSIAYVGVDTAIMHLSGANNIPCFAFFGPSSSKMWGVWDNELYNSGYTKDSGIQHMGKHTIFQESLPCVPCHKAGCNDSKISKCLIDINKNLALSKLKEFLDKII